MSAAPPPKVTWAQTSCKVFVTICLEDCKDPVINVEDKKIFFSGVGGQNNSPHEVTMDLYSEVVPEETVKLPTDRVIEVTLQKKDLNASFWPRLLQDKRRMHWLGVDFKKWRDESEDESDDGGNMEDLFSRNGGGDMDKLKQLAGGGIDLNDLGAIDDEEDDEDDSNIPGLVD